MCEWLSAREWCDVQLQCGGRTLGAHRAVLASVSTFLRRIFLSCPAEETPTFIVLPDFDLEAMSLVLYYIYNGEVVIQKQKLEMFMEIVKTMQIFVDKQYLPLASKSAEDGTLQSSNRFVESKIFTLGDNKDEPYISLKKGDHIQQIHNKYCYDDHDSQDVQMRFEDWSKRLCLRNVQSTHEDRQRSFFLRDLYIETYPRNGNANGRPAGVLAIPNERYRAAASVLLTNANGKHLETDDAHTVMLKKITDVPQWSAYIHPLKQQTVSRNVDVRLINSTEIAHVTQTHTKSALYNTKMLMENNNSFEALCLDPHLPQNPRMQSTGLNELSEKASLDLSTDSCPIEKPFFNKPYRLGSSKLREKETDYCNKNNIDKSTTNINALSRGTILNHVLDSPWCPRQPNTYRPFRRKVQNTPTVVPKSVKISPVNDDNNNVKTSPSDATETISSNVAVEPLYSIPTFDSGTDFKCSICNQVFADSEGLLAHSRRHSSPARYSCTECSKSFSQLRNFKYHMSVHRGTREFAATCAVCGKYFNDRGYLSSHMKIHRNRKEYKCSQCPKSFNQRVAYNMHVRIHTGIKPHVCGECGKAFSRKMLLKQHQRTHSGERPYTCPHCDKRFADRSNMTLHLRLHTGIKPFSCTLCPKSFTKKHHLKSHLNFHTGAKPYSCPRCKLAFTQSSNMRTHLKKCTAPEPIITAETTTST